MGNRGSLVKTGKKREKRGKRERRKRGERGNAQRPSVEEREAVDQTATGAAKQSVSRRSEGANPTVASVFKRARRCWPNWIADSVMAMVGFIDPVMSVFGGDACVRLVACDLN
ncbi:hypothetical protein F0562_005904 [Nyssa sinensis]|uniref:Uncharacterized protein n=1 Tax=Nyssa sinensis TaxID=561372 RepID=A0A5J5AN36_9ASTE|nr:hypothetical protein F0562_005904 [Nyssa sinensis]